MLVKISSDIIDSLKYFAECSSYKNIRSLINDLLNLINNNNEIEISHKGIFDISINKIEIDETGSRLNIYYIDKNNNEKVQKWKIGKFILLLFKHLFNQDLNETTVDKLFEIFIGYEGFKNYLKHNNLKIIIDDNFLKSYSSDNYINDKGSLGHSCMNDNEAVMCFYTILSSKVSIVRIEDSSGKVYGRCLLWETNKGKYLDRFYTVNNMYFSSFYLYMLKEYGINYNYVCSYHNNYVVSISIDDIKFGIKKLEKYYNKKAGEIISTMVSDGDYQSINLDTMSQFYIKFGYGENINNISNIIISNKSSYSYDEKITIEKLFLLLFNNTSIIYKYSKDSPDLSDIQNLIDLKSSLSNVYYNLLNFVSLTNHLYIIFKFSYNEIISYIGLLYPHNEKNLFYLFYMLTNDGEEWYHSKYDFYEIDKNSLEIINDIQDAIRNLSTGRRYFTNHKVSLLNLSKEYPIFFSINPVKFIDFYKNLSNNHIEQLNKIFKDQTSNDSEDLNKFYIVFNNSKNNPMLYLVIASDIFSVEKKLKEIKLGNIFSDNNEGSFRIYNDIRLLYNDIYTLLNAV